MPGTPGIARCAEAPWGSVRQRASTDAATGSRRAQGAPPEPRSTPDATGISTLTASRTRSLWRCHAESLGAVAPPTDRRPARASPRAQSSPRDGPPGIPRGRAVRLADPRARSLLRGPGQLQRLHNEVVMHRQITRLEHRVMKVHVGERHVTHRGIRRRWRQFACLNVVRSNIASREGQCAGIARGAWPRSASRSTIPLTSRSEVCRKLPDPALGQWRSLRRSIVPE